MSFLKLATTTTALSTRLLHPPTVSRAFTTSPLVKKTATETAKEAVDSVNRKVGDAAAKGIEKGQQVTEAAKATIGISSQEAEGLGAEMKGKAHEVAGEAKGKMQEGKGKASEMKGEAMGKAQEVKGEVKGKAEEVKGKM